LSARRTVAPRCHFPDTKSNGLPWALPFRTRRPR
jgi:hypothetical protein